MPDSYINPFSGMPNPQAYSQPFMSAWKERERTDAAQPFIQNSLNSQGLALQRQGQETNEFMDPTAIRRRQEEQGLGLEQAQANRQLLPQRTQAEGLGLDQKIQTLPGETQRMLEEQAQKLHTLRGKPVADLFEEMATLHPAMENSPEPLRAHIYQQAIESFKARHPGEKLPPEIETYGPHTMDSVKHAYITHQYSIAHRQKLEEIAAKGDMDNEGHRIAGQTARDVAGIHERGASDRSAAQLEAGRGVPASVQILNMRRLLADPNLPQSKRDETEETMRGIINAEGDKEVQHDQVIAGLGQTLSLKAMQGDKEGVTDIVAQIDKRKAKLQLQRYMENGIAVRMKDIKEAYPGVPDARIRALAKAEGIKLKD